MGQGLTISAVTRKTGVPSKTLRYWEKLGLLPPAGRTHTGYRLFDPETVDLVEFIKKSKSIGLTLREIRKVLELARNGKNPCPQVAKWVEEKARTLDRQIRALQALRRRLDRLSRKWSRKPVRTCFKPAELCCLIEDLPRLTIVKGGERYAKALRAPDGDIGGGSC